MNELIASLVAQHVPPAKAIIIVKQFYSVDWIQFGALWNHAVNTLS